MRSFHPPAGEPSFDCTRASARIERRLYGQIRQGYDTVAVQHELRDLQRQWLGHRDSRCLAAADRKACLTEEYQRQRETLENGGSGPPAEAAPRSASAARSQAPVYDSATGRCGLGNSVLIQLAGSKVTGQSC
jgi:hypothetical protein